MGPFDRFNDRAKRVLALAQDEAIRFNHNYIGTEHVLLGLMREGEGVAGRALGALGVTLPRLRTAVEAMIVRGGDGTSPSEITLAPQTKKVIELAIDETRKLGHSYVGTEHFLLAIVRLGSDTPAARALGSLGVGLESVRARVSATFGHTSTTRIYGVDRFTRFYRVGALDGLDDDAQRVLALAESEAAGLGHTWLGTEHLLLGLISATGTIAQRALQELGVAPDRAREQVAKTDAPSTEWQTPAITPTPRMTRLVDAAADSAGAGRITPELLLLAYAADPEAAGSRILATLGVTPEAVRETIDRLNPPR
jgi:ATP-dependent Clp protease ATP-binding subunit ClpA